MHTAKYQTRYGEDKMKRLFVMTLLSALALSACGGNGDGKSAAMPADQGTTAVEAKPTEAAKAEPTAEAVEAEPEKEEYKHYDRAAGWDELNISAGAVQVDDVLYVPGMSMDEFIAAVESSEVEYTYEYDPDELVTYNRQATVRIYRDGVEWFTGYTYNNLQIEAVKLSELPLYAVNMKENAASQGYIRFWDGRSLEDLCALDYEAVKAIPEQFPMFELDLKETSQGNEYIVTITPMNSGRVYLDKWRAIFSGGNPIAKIIIDKNTGKVSSAAISRDGGGQVLAKFEEFFVTSVMDLPEESFDQLMGEIEEKALSGFEYDSCRFVGDGIKMDSGSMSTMTEIILEMSREDGTKYYLRTEVVGLKYFADKDKMEHIGGFTTDETEYASLDELLDADYLRYKMSNLKLYE